MKNKFRCCWFDGNLLSDSLRKISELDNLVAVLCSLVASFFFFVIAEKNLTIYAWLSIDRIILNQRVVDKILNMT